VREKGVAVDQASLALETIQTLIDKVMTQIGDTPNTQSLKKDLLDTAIRGAERVTEHNQKTSREATVLAARQKLGELYLKLGEVDKAFVEYEFVYEQAQERARTQGGTEASRFNAASSSARMSDMYFTIKRDPAAAERLLAESIAGYQEILDHPQPGYGALAPYRMRLGMQSSTNKLAVLFVRSGDPTKALAEFRRSYDLLQQVSREIDDDGQLESLPPDARERELQLRPQVKSALPDLEATAIMAIGNMLHRLRQPNAAEPNYREAVAIRERLYAAKPGDPSAKFQLARTLGMLGEFLFQTGKTAAAQPLFERSTAMAKELAEADPKMTDYRRDQAVGHYRLGHLFVRLDQEEKAKEQFQLCCALREGLVDQKAPNVKRQLDWMLALVHCGKHIEATELAEKIQQESKSDNEVLLDVSRCYAQAAEAARNQPELAERYMQKSFETIRTARQAGYNDTFNLEVDADLEPFRRNPDFQKLISSAP
jgi:tetratricopeptide (TPR) repeat protein